MAKNAVETEVEEEVEVPDNAEAVAEKAWNEAESADDGDTEQPREGAADSDAEEGGDEAEADEEGPARNADGTFAKKEGEEEEPVAETPVEGDGGGAGQDIQAQPGVQQQEPVQPAKFLGWKPGERAALLALKGPEGDLIRSAAARREAQIEGSLKETEGMRRFVNDFVSRAEPYRPLYTMLQTTPLQAFDVLMRSAAILYQGDDRTKAQEVARLIQNRGINVELVADFLEGKTADGRQVPQPDPMMRQLFEKVEQMGQRFENQEQEAERRQQELADKHVADWAKDKPWYHDVKEQMGLMFQVADKQGKELTLDQAYATAISLDPEISRLEAQRVKAQSIKDLKAKADKAKRAASSPRNSPAPKGRGSAGNSAEDAASAAWDEVEGRIA